MLWSWPQQQPAAFGVPPCTQHHAIESALRSEPGCMTRLQTVSEVRILAILPPTVPLSSAVAKSCGFDTPATPGSMATDQFGLPQFSDTSFLDHLLLEADGSDAQLMNVDDEIFMGYLTALDDGHAGKRRNSLASIPQRITCMLLEIVLLHGMPDFAPHFMSDAAKRRYQSCV